MHACMSVLQAACARTRRCAAAVCCDGTAFLAHEQACCRPPDVLWLTVCAASPLISLRPGHVRRFMGRMGREPRCPTSPRAFPIIVTRNPPPGLDACRLPYRATTLCTLQGTMEYACRRAGWVADLPLLIDAVG